MASTSQSTAAGAGRGKLYKTSIPANTVADVAEIRDITASELDNFPYLKQCPDIMYWLMGTWGCESSWRLFANGNNSLHSPTDPYQHPNSFINIDYHSSNIIRNLWNSVADGSPTRLNIKEGWYAHGISATMGAYFVRGTPTNRQYRYYPESAKRIDALGIEVDPGQSISKTLFPIDTYSNRRKSIVSGMVILNMHFRAALKKFRDPNQAISSAIMTYVGVKGYRDILGTSPDDRRVKLTTDTKLISMLEAVKVVRSGQASTLSSTMIDENNKFAKSNNSTRVENNTASAATTNSGSDGKSETGPGCGKA